MDNKYSMVTAFAVYLSDGFIMELAKRLKERKKNTLKLRTFVSLLEGEKYTYLRKPLRY